MNNKELNIKAGQRLKELRLLNQLTLKDVADMLGVTHTTIMKYERGEVGAMKTITIQKLSEIFHVSPIYILGMNLSELEIEPLEKVRKIPVLGSVCAGNGIWCEENMERYFLADESLIKADFALIVEGDSMSGDGIFNRDKAFIKRTNVVDNGKIVVVLLRDTNDVTLKRVFIDKGTAILQPSNPKYSPITTNDFLILGELVGVFHKI